MELKAIKVSDIREREDRLRRVNKSSQDYLNLVNSIRQYGVLQSITVIKDPKKIAKYVLSDGDHRLTAVRDILDQATKDGDNRLISEFEIIPAQIIEVDEEQLNWTQIQANIHRKATSPMDLAKAIKRLLLHPDNQHLSHAELLAKLNFKQSPSWLNTQLSLNNLVPEAQDMLEGGQMKVSFAYSLATLPIEEQIHWLDRVNTLPVDEFMKQVEIRKQELNAEKKGLTEDQIDPLKRAKGRKIKELKAAFAEIEQKVQNNPTDYNKGKYDGIAFAISMDADTLKAKDMEKAKRDADREAFNKRRKELMEESRQRMIAEATEQAKREMATA